jgi:hypothetical protein
MGGSARSPLQAHPCQHRAERLAWGLKCQPVQAPCRTASTGSETEPTSTLPVGSFFEANPRTLPSELDLRYHRPMVKPSAEPRDKPLLRRRRRISICVTDFDAADEGDLAYWRAQTPAARLRELERLRQFNYGYGQGKPLPRLLENTWNPSIAVTGVRRHDANACKRDP